MSSTVALKPKNSKVGHIIPTKTKVMLVIPKIDKTIFLSSWLNHFTATAPYEFKKKALPTPIRPMPIIAKI